MDNNKKQVVVGGGFGFVLLILWLLFRIPAKEYCIEKIGGYVRTDAHIAFSLAYSVDYAYYYTNEKGKAVCVVKFDKMDDAKAFTTSNLATSADECTQYFNYVIFGESDAVNQFNFFGIDI